MNNKDRRKFIFTGAAVSLPPFIAQADQGPIVQANTSSWKWLEGTTWYVPTPNLLAFNYNAESNSIVPISDQTVYQITKFYFNYFFGRTVTQINKNDRVFSWVGQRKDVAQLTRLQRYFTHLRTNPYCRPFLIVARKRLHL